MSSRPSSSPEVPTRNTLSAELQAELDTLLSDRQTWNRIKKHLEHSRLITGTVPQEGSLTIRSDVSSLAQATRAAIGRRALKSALPPAEKVVTVIWSPHSRLGTSVTWELDSAGSASAPQHLHHAQASIRRSPEGFYPPLLAYLALYQPHLLLNYLVQNFHAQESKQAQGVVSSANVTSPHFSPARAALRFPTFPARRRC